MEIWKFPKAGTDPMRIPPQLPTGNLNHC